MTLLLNPWVWLAAIVVIGGSNAATAYYAWGAAKDDCIADQARDVAVAQIASEAAAEAISKIKVQNTTVRQQVEREVRLVPQYVDCRHSTEQVQRINEAITGEAPAPALAASKPS